MPEETSSGTESATGVLPIIEERISMVLGLIEAGTVDKLSPMIAQWSGGETAAVLEALPQPARQIYWELVPEELRGDVLAWLGDQVRSDLLKKLDVEEAVSATSSMDTPYLAEVVDEAPPELREAILESLGAEELAGVQDALSYPEDSAGRLMVREWAAVRADVSLDAVKGYLLKRGSLPHRTTSLMVVNREGMYLGKLSLELLLTKSPHLIVSDVMDTTAVFVNVLTPLSEVAALFQLRDLIYLPVIDDEHKLVGRINLDDAIGLIRTEAEQPMMHMAGLEVDEDLLAPVSTSVRRRLFWLGINLGTAFLAAWVIGLFEATLDRIVALAVLMPIVASMGGIAGSQTLTLAIRGLALGQITDANTRWLAVKEVSISVINGMVWAVVVGIVSWIWFKHIGIALILGAAMIINLLAAAISGLMIPLLLNRFGMDPALSGSVVLTTVTDVVGFMSFLGMATIFLL
jgi:magnesium transporter